MRSSSTMPVNSLLWFGILTVLLVVVGAGFIGPLTAISPALELEGPILPSAEPTPTSTEPAQDDSRELPEAAGHSLPYILFAIILLACTFVLARFLLSFRRERLKYTDQRDYTDEHSAPEVREMDRGAVVGRLKWAEEELFRPADSRNAVIACWLALERATEAAGTARRPQETTSEYAARVLTAFSAPAADVALLQGLYQRARFGGRTDSQVDGTDLERARVSLRNIAAAVESTRVRPGVIDGPVRGSIGGRHRT